jgi:hypothetical protein
MYSSIYNLHLLFISKATDRRYLSRRAKIKAIEEELGVAADSTMVPLTFRQRLLFGNSQAKLFHKLTKVRKKMIEVIDAIAEFDPCEIEERDVLLIRSIYIICEYIWYVCMYIYIDNKARRCILAYLMYIEYVHKCSGFLLQSVYLL